MGLREGTDLTTLNLRRFITAIKRFSKAISLSSWNIPQKTATTNKISKIDDNVNDNDIIFTSRTFVRYPYYNKKLTVCQAFFDIFIIIFSVSFKKDNECVF